MSIEDQAQVVELEEWEQNNKPPTKPIKFAPGEDGYGPAYCIDVYCDTELPPKRRAWGFTLCVGCQTKRDEASKHMRR